MEVSQLAQSQKLASDVFTDSSTIVGEGVLTFRFGTYDSGGNTFTADADRDIGTVTIDNTNSSLTGIRDAVNAAGIGITASIINDGAGSRLVFGSTSTGASSSIEVTVSGDSIGSDTDADGHIKCWRETLPPGFVRIRKFFCHVRMLFKYIILLPRICFDVV